MNLSQSPKRHVSALAFILFLNYFSPDNLLFSQTFAQSQFAQFKVEVDGLSFLIVLDQLNYLRSTL